MIGCPLPGCDGRTDSHFVCCRDHFLQLPHALRVAIWSTYDLAALHLPPDRRDAAQSPAHWAALAAALDWLLAREGVRHG